MNTKKLKINWELRAKKLKERYMMTMIVDECSRDKRKSRKEVTDDWVIWWNNLPDGGW